MQKRSDIKSGCRVEVGGVYLAKWGEEKTCM